MMNTKQKTDSKEHCEGNDISDIENKLIHLIKCSILADEVGDIARTINQQKLLKLVFYLVFPLS